jgi:hypothetical protein
MRSLLIIAALMLTGASAAAAADVPWLPDSAARTCSAAPAAANPFAVSFTATPSPSVSSRLRLSYAEAQTTSARRPVPVEYSDAYKVRARIHKIASFATLPLFAAVYFNGQDLYNHPGNSDSKKGLHGGLVASNAVLFGINSLTGAWNLWEGRKDTNHRTRRMTHGILMLAADAGFVATGMLAPDDEEGRGSSGNSRDTHRTVALTSMAVATVSYLIMLFGGD